VPFFSLLIAVDKQVNPRKARPKQTKRTKNNRKDEGSQQWVFLFSADSVLLSNKCVGL